MAATFDAILRINAQTTGDADVRKLTGAISGLGGAAKGVGALTTALTGVGAALGGISVAAGAKGIIDMADSLDELSQRSGVTVETLSKLGLAARQSGLDTEQVSGALVKLSRNLGNIATGGGQDAAAALATLGISATDSSGRLKNADQVLMEVADRFQQMPDGAMKAKLAMDLFGKSGAGLIPVLNMGSDAIEGLNTGISAEFARNAGVFNDQMQTITAQAAAFGVAILEQVLPYLIKGADAAIDFGFTLLEALQRNKEPIKAMIGSFVETAKMLLPVAANLAKVYVGFQALRGVILAATLATKAYALVTSLTPQGLLMLGAAALIGFKAFEAIERKMNEITAAAEKGNTATATGTGLTRQMADAAEEAAEAYAKGNTEKDRGKELAKEIAANEKLLGEQIKQSNTAFDASIQLINLRSNALEQSSAIAAEENNLQLATNSLGQAILQNKLALARTDQEKLMITRQIAELEQEAADLQFQATMQQIELERQLLVIKEQAAEAEFQKARAALITAINMAKQGKVPMSTLPPLTNQTATARANAQAATAEREMFDQRAAVRGQIADVNRQMAMVRTNGQVQQAVAALQTLQGNVNTGTNQWGNTFFVNVPQFASGGYVTGRTLAMIGEGGEPEYVVPASKASQFANNIVAGRTGEQALRSWTDQMSIGALAPKGGFTSNLEQLAALRQQGIRADFSPMTGLVVQRRSVAPPSSSSSVAFGARSLNPLAGMSTTQVQSLGPVEVRQNLQINSVERRSDGDYVTLATAEQLAANASSDAVNQIIKMLQQPTFRRQVGIA